MMLEDSSESGTAIPLEDRCRDDPGLVDWYEEETMGRTYLSIKLAAAFGLVVGLAVALTVGVAATAPAGGAPATSADAVVAPLVDAEAEPVPCLWRSCPALMPHRLLQQPRLRAVAPADAAKEVTRVQRAT
jgi:hypothetical protein